MADTAAKAVPADTQSRPEQFVPDEVDLRARFYALLSALLVAPPSQNVLNLLGALDADDTPLGQALGALADAARQTGQATVREEYDAIFIGITRGEIVPYASYYLTGFLHEKPLAVIRRDLAALGVERSPDRCEPEDHLGFLLETMHGLILQAWPDAPPNADQTFFQNHLHPWADACLADIEAAPSARLYAPLATVGRLFLAIERDAFGMAPETPTGTRSQERL